jgi:hypothetical protein
LLDRRHRRLALRQLYQADLGGDERHGRIDQDFAAQRIEHSLNGAPLNGIGHREKHNFTALRRRAVIAALDRLAAARAQLGRDRTRAFGLPRTNSQIVSRRRKPQGKPRALRPGTSQHRDFVTWLIHDECAFQ